jgi:hypothetical protein
MFLSIFSPVNHMSVCVCECVFVFVCMFMCINAGMPDCLAFRYWNEKTNDAMNGLVPDQVKAVQHFLVQYLTEKIDAGMPMPALVFSMPMPSYGILESLLGRSGPLKHFGSPLRRSVKGLKTCAQLGKKWW